MQTVKMPVYLVYADPDADGGGFWSAEISAGSKAYQHAFWAKLS